MKKITKILGIAVVMASLASCSVSGPLLLTDNGNKPNKVGESSYTSIMGFPPIKGDASIETAAKNGGITKISTVDMKIKGGFLTTKYITVVTGE